MHRKVIIFLFLLFYISILLGEDIDITITSSIRKGKSENWEKAFFSLPECEESVWKDNEKDADTDMPDNDFKPVFKIKTIEKKKKRSSFEIAVKKQIPVEDKISDVSDDDIGDDIDIVEDYSDKDVVTEPEKEISTEEETSIEFSDYDIDSVNENNDTVSDNELPDISNEEIIKRRKERHLLRKNSSLIKSNH